MNIFVIKNWYHYDLNFKIINYLKTNNNNIDNKEKLKKRIEYDFKLKLD